LNINIVYKRSLKFLLATLLWFAGVSHSTYGQGGIDGELIELNYRIENHSPKAAGLGMFGDIPVSKSSGIPDVSIPIYNLQLQDFTLPIQLKYHAGGIKVDQVSSEVGLGWSLSAGGAIITQPRSSTDLNSSWAIPENVSAFNPNIAGFNNSNLNDYYFLQDALDNCYDMEKDIYSFSLVDDAGKIIEVEPGKFRTIPFNKYLISKTNIGFTIVDKRGNTYFFNDIEITEITDLKCSGHSGGIGCSSVNLTKNYYLTKIITNNKDHIDFTYESENFTYEHSWNFTDYKLNPTETTCRNSFFNNTANYCLNGNVTYGKRLTSITTSKGHQIDFLYSSNRKDLPGSKSLTQIRISFYNEIKTIGLTSSYFIGNGVGNNFVYSDFVSESAKYRLRLDAVVFGEDEKYQFKYENDIPSRLSFAQDYYGQYNGQENTTLIPKFSFFSDIPGANREPNREQLNAGILKEITYPTGGTSAFFFEPNTDKNNNILEGLRIKRIVNKDFTGDSIGIKYFEYMDPSTNKSSLVNGKVLKAGHFSVNKLQWQINNESGHLIECPYLILSSNPAASFFHDFSGAGVAYEYVTEYNNSGNNSGGKTVYKYSSANMFNDFNPGLKIDLSWANGLLLEKQVYKAKDDKYILQRQEKSRYKLYSYTQDLTSNELFKSSVSFKVEHYNVESPTTQFGGRRPAQFDFYFYYDISGFFALEEMETREFGGENGVELITTGSFGYDPLFTIKTSEKFSTSTGSYLKKYRYPFHYNTTIHRQMVGNNEINKVVEELHYKNDRVIKGYVNNYRLFGEQRIKVASVSRLETATPVSNYIFSATEPKADHRLVPYIDIMYDDVYGNVTQVRQDGISVAYLYDKDGNYNVAQAVNAEIADFAYTSFESGADDSWQFDVGRLRESESYSGSTSLILNQTALVLTKSLDSAKKYKLSLWCKKNQEIAAPAVITVNGVDVEVADKWAFHELEVKGGALKIEGNALVDEVRVHPEHSNVLSFIYRPLAGIKTMLDRNGQRTFYDYYDSTFRLRMIKDDHLNILQSFEYNFYNTSQ
jgi:hypothetical protein